jgi:thymidine phosphorylase
MVETAEGLGVRTMAQITEMSHPIGTHVGNALEVVESIHVLKGGGSSDTRSLVIMQGAALLSMTLNLSRQEAEKRMEEVLDNGKALEVFAAMCEQQGVSETTVQRLIHDPESVVERARETTTVVAPNRGFLHSIDALTMANIAREHGAGRFDLNDTLDLSVGFVVHVERGEAVMEGDPILTFHHRRPLPEATLTQLTVLPQIVQEPVSTNGRLLETVQFPTTKP